MAGLNLTLNSSNINTPPLVVDNNKEKGAVMVEYGLMVALMAILCIASVINMRNGTAKTFRDVSLAVMGTEIYP